MTSESWKTGYYKIWMHKGQVLHPPIKVWNYGIVMGFLATTERKMTFITYTKSLHYINIFFDLEQMKISQGGNYSPLPWFWQLTLPLGYDCKIFGTEMTGKNDLIFMVELMAYSMISYRRRFQNLTFLALIL